MTPPGWKCRYAYNVGRIKNAQKASNRETRSRVTFYATGKVSPLRIVAADLSLYSSQAKPIKLITCTLQNALWEKNAVCFSFHRKWPLHSYVVTCKLPEVTKTFWKVILGPFGDENTKTTSLGKHLLYDFWKWLKFTSKKANFSTLGLSFHKILANKPCLKFHKLSSYG